MVLTDFWDQIKHRTKGSERQVCKYKIFDFHLRRFQTHQLKMAVKFFPQLRIFANFFWWF